MIKETVHRIYKKMELHDHPLRYLFLEITRRCNLSCLHCGSDCRTGADPELTTESWQKIIRFVHDHFGRDVTLVITGGEPLLHPDLMKIAGTIHELGMNWGMVTNGLLLTKPLFEKLTDTGLTSLTVSLDGTKSGHEKLRNRKGSYEQALNALSIVGSSGLPFKDAVTCVYPGNLDELDGTAEALMERGINYWRLFRIFPLGRAKNNPALTLDPAQTRRMLEWIKSNRSAFKKKGLNLNYSCEGYMPFGWDTAVRDAPYFCRAGVNIASVLSDGSITGCSNNQSRFYQGNILRDNFQYLWENRFEVFRDRDWAKQGKCSRCAEFGKCGGSSIHLWDNDSSSPEFCYLDSLKG
jgi:radical SAM protein with 4Fe4S-binding SPASM domain